MASIEGARRAPGVVFGALIAIAALLLAIMPTGADAAVRTGGFERVSTFEVQDNAGSEVAEIVAASDDGNTLIYTDSAAGALGFVDITDPAAPVAAGLLELGLDSDLVDIDGDELQILREPTSVAVAGGFALAGVNIFPDGDETVTALGYLFPRGELAVVDIATQTVVRSIPLGGQPDSVAVSPDGRYAAVAIENERNEELGDGEPEQYPGGYVVVVDLRTPSDPTTWVTTLVDLDGVADLYPTDAEPEFIDINRGNIAAVSLQENNHMVFIDLATATIIEDWAAGSVDLTDVDTIEDGIIDPAGSLEDVPREPDSIAWVGNRVATANEGDLFGGSRGFAMFDTRGNVTYDAGSAFEHVATSIGHYPESRSENKGSEPEGIEYGEYRGAVNGQFLFVGSERGSFVGVYDVRKPDRPQLMQVLPTGLAPEGMLAIPSRDLFVVASEATEGFYRSAISLYELLREEVPSYPTIHSGVDDAGLPIGWGALSGLTADPVDADTLYAVQDSYYSESVIFSVDVSVTPALITEKLALVDDAGEPLGYDPEGVAVAADGGWWVASEGAAEPGADDFTPNLLLDVAADGTVVEIGLPDDVVAEQKSNGFEGVASVGTGADEQVYVAFQREWKDDASGLVKIGRYTPGDGTWAFFHYPLDAPESAAGGWVGLSEITAIDDTTFAIVERD
ncbi:esterase-like activity of phytase family protein, partial [Ilumatobacter sp.]|uniref:esterase-like activity of phytase family protein n=1 Tax=Ilumatobacter sp. TaxID=1967498 RepID=UPI003C32A67E